MLPIIPHVANECLSSINEEKNIKWPETEKKFLENEKCNIVVQINGKKRSLLSVEQDLDEKNVLEIVKNDKTIEKYFVTKNIDKVIYVKNKIINLIIN